MLASLVLLSAAVACSDGSTAPAPAATDAPSLATMAFIGIAVGPDSNTLAPGGSITLTRMMRGSDGVLSTLIGQEPTWTSTNAGIATVSSTGVVKGIAPGVARIVANQWGLFADTALVTVVGPATATQLSPATVSIPLWQTTLLRTAALPAGTPVTWRSSRPEVAIVNASGLVSSMGVGTTTISASYGTTVATATVTITTPTVATAWSALPMLVSRPFQSIAQATTDVAGAEGFLPNGEVQSIFNKLAAIVPDSTSPGANKKAVEFRFPAGTIGGGSQGNFEKILPAGTGQLHVTAWVKFSPNFQGHLTGTSPKVIIPFSQHQPRVVVRGRGAGSARLNLSVALQGVPDSRSSLEPNMNVAAAEIVRGQWQRWDLRFKANTPGMANGEVHAWLNGVKVIQYTNVAIAKAGENPAWQTVRLNPIWGGLSDVVRSDMYLRVDDLTVSAAP